MSVDSLGGVTKIIRLPKAGEMVIDLAGDAMVEPYGEIFWFSSLLSAWRPFWITGEAAARRCAANRWPRAQWQTMSRNVSMISSHRAYAELNARLKASTEVPK